MDLPSLNALLRVNGLSSQSSPEAIRTVLLRSSYSPAEVEEAFALFKGEPLPTTALPSAALGAYTATTVEYTQHAALEDVSFSIFAGRIGVLQFWLATLLLFACSILLFLLVEVTALPLFAIVTGLSPFALPDLVMLPLHTLVLLVIGAVMAVAPIGAFFILFAGLQMRRYHDFGLSVKVWAAVIVAEIVVRYVLTAASRASTLVSLGLILITIVLLSWPGTAQENEWGAPFRFSSLLGALLGSEHKEGMLKRGYRRVILPVVYVEAVGILFAFAVSSILPRIPLSLFSPSTDAHPASVSALGHD